MSDLTASYRYGSMSFKYNGKYTVPYTMPYTLISDFYLELAEKLFSLECPTVITFGNLLKNYVVFAH